MRRFCFLLMPLLLSGCVDGSATYYVTPKQNDHTLSLRMIQDFVWKKDVTLTLVAARLPDCQRQLKLGELPIDEAMIELFQASEYLYNLRAGTQLWQVDTQTCSLQAPPQPNQLGAPLGVFMLDKDKVVFEPAVAEPAAAPAASQAPQTP
jgi:hypothetical protein